jgi:hypothetical protein
MVVWGEFVYGQVIKHQKRAGRWKSNGGWWVKGSIKPGCEAGLSGKINTAFVERINLTIRQWLLRRLTRWTWGPAWPGELAEHRSGGALLPFCALS